MAAYFPPYLQLLNALAGQKLATEGLSKLQKKYAWYAGTDFRYPCRATGLVAFWLLNGGANRLHY